MRCIIVDDNEEYLASASRLLGAQGMEVVAVATTAERGLELARTLGPDVALVDIELGEADGIELSHELASHAPTVRVVLVSSYALDDMGELVAHSPAAGFLPKTDLGAAAIRQLLA